MPLIKGASKTRRVLMRCQLSKYQNVKAESATARSAGDETTTASPPSTRLCTPCPYPTTYVPNIDQFSAHQYTELAFHFHGLIKDLWRKVWFGLYQVQDKHGPSHASQIRKLYAGAGMAELLRSRSNGSGRRLEDMYRLFWGKWEMIGLGDLSTALCEHARGSSHHNRQPALAQLKIYDGIALDNLQYTVMLLKEYEHQVEAISELYRFLQQHQADDTTAEDRRQSTVTHQIFLLREFRQRADTIAAALADLDGQTLVLQRDMDNEAREIHGRLEGIETMVLREEVLSPE
ncbi:hypothetical protein UA08_03472 [Talaromyces atroroseus]|uniref:Uncharacterized protein n=1 Tax=Talaromyces atroroseus TaxID=1441469 RepID=A0A225AJV3_TALAT|nr:hypothetical protein UA08_03472 [Talaromyces atroroseus]OKL61150.1 hypothetical protein UA08_03472 [Talaromyces atroroseus]